MISSFKNYTQELLTKIYGCISGRRLDQPSSINLFIFVFFVTFASVSANSYASTGKEINQPFGNWLVSCKENLTTAKHDCFIGTPFEDKHGRGAIVFTKYYLAVAHNDLNLNEGIGFKIDNKQTISSYMNTGVSVFFKSADRNTLLKQMSSGKNLTIIINGITTLIKSLDGFSDAYAFYIKQVQD